MCIAMPGFVGDMSRSLEKSRDMPTMVAENGNTTTERLDVGCLDAAKMHIEAIIHATTDATLKIPRLTPVGVTVVG